MKKIFISLLLTLSLLLCGCNGSDSDTTHEKSTDALTQVETTEVADDAYKDIECRDIDGYSKQYFSFSGSEYAIYLTYPEGWTFKKDQDGSYTIMRDGNAVGIIIKGEAQDTAAWKSVHSEANTNEGIKSSVDIEKSLRESNSHFRYRFTFSYNEELKDNVLTLITDYAELNTFAANKLAYSSLISTESVTGMGVLKQLKSLSRPNLLILGNSFINSSNIGYILQEMCDVNNRSVEVEAVSIGYATVNTYISDTTIMQNIRRGLYDAVFICGFYSSGEVSNLGVLKSACDSSGTKLVIFPAHNESASVVSSARSAYKDLVCLDWKAELDSLISNGVDRWKLCYDDAYDHSTALAGYVGAHMIYRALFDELPKADMKYNIDQSDVDAILGDYVSTGTVKKFDKSKVIYLY